MNFNLLIDQSWCGNTGIGLVYNEYNSRLINSFNVMHFNNTYSKRNPFQPIIISNIIKNSKDSIFWSVGFIPPYMPKINSIITVHDLTHLHYYSKFHRLYYNLVYRNLYKNQNINIVTVSDFTKNELASWTGIDLSRIHHIPNAVSEKFNPDGEKFLHSSPYIFYPGNRRKYKNIERMLFAYSLSKAHNDGIQLLMTGYSDSWTNNLIRKFKLSNHVFFLGNLSSEMIYMVYRSSLAIIYPSLYEGFGLPVLEGMASGVPVVASKITSIPEVGGESILYFNPFLIDEISNAIDQIIFDSKLRCNLITKGLERVKIFSWDESFKKLKTLIYDINKK